MSVLKILSGLSITGITVVSAPYLIAGGALSTGALDGTGASGATSQNLIGISLMALPILSGVYGLYLTYAGFTDNGM
jgi:hypothetical protein